MKLLLASSELHPYSKTGGLADMVGALAKALARRGNQVGVLTPLYSGIREGNPGLQLTGIPIDLALGVNRVRGEVWSLTPEPNLTIYFLDQPDLYQRAGLYQAFGVDYPDNAERFLFFSKCVAQLALHLSWQPEILHLHDWQCAMAALLIAHQRTVPGWENAPRTCLTIHNLAYQGVFPASQYALTNLPWSYFSPAGVEFFGQMNCLKAGIAYADVLSTVSPTYAQEITTPELGCGLDGLLRYRRAVMRGILNGVDYDEWNTTSNGHLRSGFSLDDLAGKAACKLDLQHKASLSVDADVPLFASIGRLAEQKGVDILLPALEEMLSSNLQCVLLGSGSTKAEQAFRDLADAFPGKFSARIGFDEGYSHQVEAGSDFFLMPSRFEPCGLNQMYSLRYGTIPIVRRTGGLQDSVVDATEDLDLANGIKFTDYSTAALAKAIQKAQALYAEKELLRHYRANAMTADFSWERVCTQYEDLYKQALAG